MERLAKGKVTYKTGQNLEPIAQAIISMGQSASKKDRPDVLANKIKAISTDATGVEGEMLVGKTFYAGGNKKTGSMANNGAWTNRLGINNKIVIPQGYHNGQGYIDQSIATKGAQTYTPSTVNQTIGAGQYLSGTQTILGDPNLVAANIRIGKSIFGVNGNYKGDNIYLPLISKGMFKNGFSIINAKKPGTSSYTMYINENAGSGSEIYVGIYESNPGYGASICAYCPMPVNLTDYNTFRIGYINSGAVGVSGDVIIGFAPLNIIQATETNDFYKGNGWGAFCTKTSSETFISTRNLIIDTSQLKGNYYFCCAIQSGTPNANMRFYFDDFMLYS